MHLEEFKHYNNICVNIKDSRIPKKINVSHFKFLFPTSFQSIDLISLLGFPSRGVKKKVISLIESKLSRKIPLNFISKISEYLSLREQTRFFEFSLYYLISTDFKLYSALKKEIHKYFSLYKPFLIESLVHENDTIALNAGRILNEFEPDNYESDKIIDLLPKLLVDQKEKLFQILKFRLKTLNLDLHIKEDAILKLGSLDYIHSNQVLEQYMEDPNIEIRKTLAISLGFLHSDHSLQLLYKLLLDEFKEIHYLAAESLAKIIPGLYSQSSPQEILLSLEPLTLLKIMPNRPFDSYIKRLWRKNQHSSTIIEKYHNLSVPSIIQGYQKILLQASNQDQIKSIKLIILSRMPHILVDMEEMLDSEENSKRKTSLMRVISEIQYFAKIESKDEFPILL